LDLKRAGTLPQAILSIRVNEYGIRYTKYKCQELFSLWIYFNFNYINEKLIAAGLCNCLSVFLGIVHRGGLTCHHEDVVI
jgi:predicted nucleic acid-binding Zn finger protein